MTGPEGSGLRREAAEEVRVTVIGCGFAGLCMTIKLLKARLGPVMTVEKANDVGGTWLANTHPGAACDVPALLYSYSFEPDTDWSSYYPPQEEILAYLKRVADKYELEKQGVLRLRTRVVDARWSETDQCWQMLMQQVSGGDPNTEPTVEREYRVRSQFLICATGKLIVPSIPKVEGLESFKGASFHTACWDQSLDLKGKRVAVVGSGASALQVVPSIAPQVGHLTVFQRSPAYIQPRRNYKFSPALHAALRVPLVRWRVRGTIYWVRELVWGPCFFTVNHPFAASGKRIALRYLEEKVKDPKMREALTPNYAFGCKRVGLSDDYYDALVRENVSLVASPVTRVTETGVVDNEGNVHEVDVIIWATGFSPSAVYNQLDVFGRGGKSWHDIVGGGDKTAFLGMSCSELPNFFLMNGPNTNLPHTSVLLVSEANARYIVDLIKQMDKSGAAVAEVKARRVAEYKHEMKLRLSKSAWFQGGCTSWYLNPKVDGFSDVVWPGYVSEYALRTSYASLGDYDLVNAAGKGLQVPKGLLRYLPTRLTTRNYRPLETTAEQLPSSISGDV